MKKGVCIILLFISLGLQATESSKGLSIIQKSDTLARHITLKSTIIDTEFILYDVNSSPRSIPGASSKDLKIIMIVKPEDVRRWTQGKEKMITSFPKSRAWLTELPASSARTRALNGKYLTYYEKKNGYEYTLWADTDGVILIRFIQN
ncbi:MAG TPA: hypothetical protein VF857_08545 [Spirochaetota bacterium]